MFAYRVVLRAVHQFDLKTTFQICVSKYAYPILCFRLCLLFERWPIPLPLSCCRVFLLTRFLLLARVPLCITRLLRHPIVELFVEPWFGHYPFIGNCGLDRCACYSVGYFQYRGPSVG